VRQQRSLASRYPYSTGIWDRFAPSADDAQRVVHLVVESVDRGELLSVEASEAFLRRTFEPGDSDGIAGMVAASRRGSEALQADIAEVRAAEGGSRCSVTGDVEERSGEFEAR
jgi:hypothetical protein